MAGIQFALVSGLHGLPQVSAVESMKVGTFFKITTTYNERDPETTHAVFAKHKSLQFAQR